MFLVSACSCLCAIYWNHMLSWEWRCCWSSADRRCANYIWVINNFIAYKGASYIRDFPVIYYLFTIRHVFIVSPSRQMFSINLCSLMYGAIIVSIATNSFPHFIIQLAVRLYERIKDQYIKCCGFMGKLMRRSVVTSGSFIKIDRYPATISPWPACQRWSAETIESNGFKAKITQNKKDV